MVTAHNGYLSTSANPKKNVLLERGKASKKIVSCGNGKERFQKKGGNRKPLLGQT